jgi:hypothetical protein
MRWCWVLLFPSLTMIAWRTFITLSGKNLPMTCFLPEVELFSSPKSRLANGLYGEIVRRGDYSATLQSQSCSTAIIVMMTNQRLHFSGLYCETDRLQCQQDSY